MLNRANGRLRLFKKDEDYAAFERTHIERCSPMGSEPWVKATAHALGLQQTLN